ncbi:suppressor of fused domain protein [Suttonella ornithocola]|uniref:Suppressor of fused protein (SUFU) n=1 Tax=Suttonella ornithocola TaxID=279832 RepID=A0A380MQZ0_9GAMM|nr:suppressor of fused domain protein [Suttonella ornithocola]SUO94476.1 Suppressor of fused protein (SUFU) [Suttonella ornithocola]
MNHSTLQQLIEALEEDDFQFNPPATEAELSAFEAQHQIELSPLFKALYLKANGSVSTQTVDMDALSDFMEPSEHGLSKEDLQNMSLTDRWLSLTEIETAIQTICQKAEDYFGNDWQDIILEQDDNHGEYKPYPFHTRWLPISKNSLEQYFCLDFDPQEDGEIGQVLLINIGDESIDEDWEVYRMANSFENWVESYWLGEEESDIATLFDEIGQEMGVLTSDGEFNQEGYFRSAVHEHLMNQFGDENFMVIDETEYPGDALYDIYWFAPEEQRPYHALATNGLSTIEMPSAEDGDTKNTFEHIELLAFFPPEYFLNGDQIQMTEQQSWILAVFKTLAELLKEGQRIDINSTFELSGVEALPFKEISLRYSTLFTAQETLISTAHGESIRQLVIVPLYSAEQQYQYEYGYAALNQTLKAANVGDIINPQRANAVSQQ